MLTETIVVGGLTLGAVVGTVALQVALRPFALRVVAARRQIAEACGLQGIEGDDRALTGRHGRLFVCIAVDNRRGSLSPRVSVYGLLPDLRIERAGLASRLLEAVGTRDLEVGDPAFDSDLTVRASSSGCAALALLDAETRARLRAVFGAGYPVTVAFGTLSADLVKHVGRPQHFTLETMQALLALGHRLEPPSDAEARLARIAAGDPLCAVRAKALCTLTEVASLHPQTREALRAGARDPEPTIRLQAAKALGAAGEPVLQALAVDDGVDDVPGAEAIAALGARFTIQDARLVLARSVEAGHARTAQAALSVVAQGGSSEVPGIAAVLSLARAPLALAASEALAAIGGPSVEAPLVEALAAPQPVVAAAAAHALARCGGVGAVPALKEAEGRGGDVGRAARTALGAIQSRLTGASPGQLALAGGDAGQLSVADSTDGRVTLPAAD
jgi:hypothetical protein